MKKHLSIMCYLLLFTVFIIINGCASYAPQHIPPHINLSPLNMELAPDSDKSIDFGMTVESNESDSLDNLEILPGVRVRAVRPGGAAEKAGIKSNDVILSVNNTEINQPDALSAISQTVRSDEYKFMVRRDTTVFETSIFEPVAVKTSDPKERYRADPIKTRAGFRTEMIQLNKGSGKQGAARIVQMRPDSPFARSGIEVGDAVTAVDNIDIESAQDLINRLTNDYDYGQNVLLSIQKKDSSGILDKTVTLWAPERKLTGLSVWPLFSYKSSADKNNTKFSFLHLIILKVFSYEQDENEKKYSILGFIRFKSGSRGELVDKVTSSDRK